MYTPICLYLNTTLCNHLMPKGNAKTPCATPKNRSNDAFEPKNVNKNRAANDMMWYVFDPIVAHHKHNTTISETTQQSGLTYITGCGQKIISSSYAMDMRALLTI